METDTNHKNNDYNFLKKLPKEYLILKLTITFNKELFEKKIISFEIYSKMQQLLLKRQDKIILDNKTKIL